MIDLRQIYYNINFMSSNIYLLLQELGIIENKTVEKLLPIHEAQLLTYLKLSNLTLGFLLNWNVTLMKDGIKRMVNNLQQWSCRRHGIFC